MWFVQHARSAEPIAPVMHRSYAMACAFRQWVSTRYWAICEMNMVVKVKSRVSTVLLSNIVDAWARLAIKSDRPPSEPSARHPPEYEVQPPPASGRDEQDFLGEKLVPRGPRVWLGAQAWSSLSAELMFENLPGSQPHAAAILSMLQVCIPWPSATP